MSRPTRAQQRAEKQVCQLIDECDQLAEIAWKKDDGLARQFFLGRSAGLAQAYEVLTGRKPITVKSVQPA